MIIAVTTASILLLLWGVWLQTSFPGYLNTSQALVNCIGVLVAFVPEGLPIAVTLTLTIICQRMAAFKVLGMLINI